MAKKVPDISDPEKKLEIHNVFHGHMGMQGKLRQILLRFEICFSKQPCPKARVELEQLHTNVLHGYLGRRFS